MGGQSGYPQELGYMGGHTPYRWGSATECPRPVGLRRPHTKKSSHRGATARTEAVRPRGPDYRL